MDYYFQAAGSASRLAILPGAFNPPTRAHVAMAEAALSVVDEVLFVLPRAFPHKDYAGPDFDQRLKLLRAALAGHTRFSLAASERGMFIDLANEARQAYANAELYLLCGRDAAERIVSWDYGDPGEIGRQLEVFRLLVASRGAHYEPPREIRSRVQTLSLPADLAEISSTEVRRRIRAGEPWRALLPKAVAALVEDVY